MKKIRSIFPSIVGFIAITILYLFITWIGSEDDGAEAINGDAPLETVADLLVDSSSNEPLAKEDMVTYIRGKTYQANVERVVDGDTIVVNVNGEQRKVRLSGIDTPESVGDYEDNPQFYGKEASAYTEELLDGKTIWLEEDIKPTDKYDRYLLYVWLEDPLTTEFLEGCVNAILIREGYADWFDDYDNRMYAEAFEAYEADAKGEGIGIWQER